MLEKQDLQAIKELIDTSITASEERTQAKLDAMEARMTSKIDASEARLQAKIDDVDNHWRAYAESYITPNFKLLAEGHQTLLETLARKDRVEALEEEVVFLKSVVSALAQDVTELKKAQ